MIYIFIINPMAGRASSVAQIGEKLAVAFADAPGLCEVYVTQHPGDATAFAQRRCAARREDEQLCFFGCGGDGTAGEIAAGIYGYSFARLGIVPCGTGNDFIKCFPNRDFTDIAAQRAGSEQTIDLIRCNGKLSLNICNAGLDANVARDISLFKRLPLMGGPVAYLASLCKNFFGRLGAQAVVTCDGKSSPKCALMLLVLANGRYYGGSFMGAPDATPEDGLMDLCIVPLLGRWKILGVLPRYQKGRHTTDPDLCRLVSYRKCRHVRVEYDNPITLCIDGEVQETRVVEAELLPQALRIWLPAAPYSHSVPKDDKKAVALS